MATTRTISYSQRFEDLYLMRCFAGRERGFYIDIGAGHPVYDNVSFAFYLQGWSGLAVAAPGEATFYLVDDYHGFSTTSAENAATAQSEFGKSSQPMTRPVTT